MEPMQAADSLYQSQIVPLFASKTVKRPDKFRLVRVFVEFKQSICKGAARAVLENEYLNLVSVINEIKGGLHGK